MQLPRFNLGGETVMCVAWTNIFHVAGECRGQAGARGSPVLGAAPCRTDPPCMARPRLLFLRTSFIIISHPPLPPSDLTTYSCVRLCLLGACGAAFI